MTTDQQVGYKNFWEDPQNLLCPLELEGAINVCVPYICPHKHLTQAGKEIDLYSVWEDFQRAYFKARSEECYYYVRTKYGVISKQTADKLFGRTIPIKIKRFIPPCRYGNKCYNRHCHDGHNIGFCGNDPDCKNILCQYRHSLPLCPQNGIGVICLNPFCLDKRHPIGQDEV